MNTIQKPNKIVAVYGRVSTSNQENEGTIETQLSAVREFASKNNFNIVQEYLDNGWSGDSLVRPSLDQLRVDAKKKVWEAVLIYDPDRLARRSAWQEVVIEELKEVGVDVLFVTIPPAKTDEDVIMYKMRGVFTEYERMKIKERFRLGKVRKAKEGHIIVTEAPFGYNFIQRTADKQGYLEINEHEAEIVKSIFSWVVNDGLTLRGVVRKLQALDIPPRKSKRGVWNTSTLSTMLRNKTYIGQAHYGASYATIPINPTKKEGYKKVKKTSRRMKPEEEWITIPTPKIIDEKIFNLAGEQLKSNFQLTPRNTKNEYLLTGKIWCQCGVRRAGEGPQHGKHLYYRCTDRVKSFPLPPTCQEMGFNARIVDELVWQGIVDIINSPERLLEFADRFKERTNNKITPLIVNTENVIKEITKLKEQESRYVKAYGVGAISIDQLKDFTNPLKEKISSLDTQLSKMSLGENKSTEDKLPNKNEIESYSKDIGPKLRGLNFISKKAIVKEIVDTVVGNHDKLKVNGCIPVISNINVFTEYRNRRSAKRWEVDAV